MTSKIYNFAIYFLIMILFVGCTTIPKKMSEPKSDGAPYKPVSPALLKTLDSCIPIYSIMDRNDARTAFKDMSKWYEDLSNIKECNIDAFNRHVRDDKVAPVRRGLARLDFKTSRQCISAKRRLITTFSETVDGISKWPQEAELICAIDESQENADNSQKEFCKQLGALQNKIETLLEQEIYDNEPCN